MLYVINAISKRGVFENNYFRNKNGGINLKNSIKTLAMWLIIGIIFIIVLSSIMENSSTKLKYKEYNQDSKWC